MRGNEEEGSRGNEGYGSRHEKTKKYIMGGRGSEGKLLDVELGR